MTKYRAKVDTVFNFRVIRAGKEVVAGEELRNSPNFECIDGSTGKTIIANANTETQQKPDGMTEYAQAVLRAKELGIPKYNKIPKLELLAAVAEAEAKLAAPAPDNSKVGNESAKTDEQGSKTDGTVGNCPTGEDDKSSAGNENSGGNDAK